MDLALVRRLKREIRSKRFTRAVRELFCGPSFAYGIGLTEKPGHYRLTIDVVDADTAEWFLKKYAPVIGKYIDDVDIRIAGPVQAIPPSPTRDPYDDGVLAIGARICHERGSDGTLGFFARRNGVKGFVSCSHVIGLKDDAAPNDAIHGPAGTKVGELQFFTHLNGGSAAVPADCAFASVADAHWPTAPGALGRDRVLRTTTPVLTKKTPVFKLGARTTETSGVVTKIEIDGFRFDYQSFFTNFDDVIEIESASDTDSFSDPGDSGALVVTAAENEPVGLLFGERVGGRGNMGLHYVNPIAFVLKALGDAEIVVA